MRRYLLYIGIFIDNVYSTDVLRQPMGLDKKTYIRHPEFHTQRDPSDGARSSCHEHYHLRSLMSSFLALFSRSRLFLSSSRRAATFPSSRKYSAHKR